MNKPETTVITVRNSSDIDELIERLPSLSHGRVVVSIPEDSSLLLTAADLSRPLVAARANDVTLALETNDPLRQEVARMIGWPIADPGQAHRANGQTDSEVDDQYATTADLATYVPSSPFTVRRGTPEGESDAHASTVVLTPVREQDPVDEGETGFDVDQPPRTPGRGTGQPEAKRFARGSGPQRRGMLTIVGAIAAPLVVLGVVAALLVYILPTSTVTVVPKVHTISADLSYGLAVPGATYDITIEPTAISNTTVFDQTIPTTGERFEPDGTANGTLHFVNPNVEPITIPAGTELEGDNGITYITQNDVTVPGADPFGDMSLGSATGTVSATQPGPDGNTDAGTIVGQLGNGVFYTNRGPIGGGTMKRIAVVTQADIDALEAAAQQDLAARAEQEFLGKVDPALKLVPDSLVVGEPQIEFNHAAGEDAAEVSVHASVDVSAQAYDPAQLHAQAAEEAGGRLALAAQTRPEVIVLADSVEIGDPLPLNGEETAFTVHAEAVVRSLITEEERRQLAESLVGKSLDDAGRILAGVEDIASYDIVLLPEWLPDRMPELASRIQIDVISEDQINRGP